MGSGARTKVTTMRLPEDMAAELAFVARADEMTISDIVRAALQKYISGRKADEEFQAKLKECLEEDRRLAARLKP